MPILGTGNQGVPIEAMLPELLEVAWRFLHDGLPLDELKIVVYNDREKVIAEKIFGEFSQFVGGSARFR